MRLRIVAALGLAAGLIAAPAFAANTTTPPAAGAPPAAAPAEPMANHAPMHHHMMTRHHMAHSAMAAPDSEHMTIEQLNDQSLQAAKRGSNYAPPPPPAPPPSK
jgi:hypothetical protein